jgi:Large extracellular alpha-helical protein
MPPCASAWKSSTAGSSTSCAPGALGPGDCPTALQPGGVQVHLLNPSSWLKAGTASLQIEVKSKKAGKPAGGAGVKVQLEGATGPVEFQATTDDAGRVDISFPMPRLGPGGTELVIRAKGPAGEDEIRYSLKPKSKPAS